MSDSPGLGRILGREPARHHRHRSGRGL